MADEVKMEKVSTCPKCGAPIYAPEWDGYGELPKVHFTCTCRLDVQHVHYYHHDVPQYIPYVAPLTLPFQPPWSTGCGSIGG